MRTFRLASDFGRAVTYRGTKEGLRELFQRLAPSADGAGALVEDRPGLSVRVRLTDDVLDDQDNWGEPGFEAPGSALRVTVEAATREDASLHFLASFYSNPTDSNYYVPGGPPLAVTVPRSYASRDSSWEELP